MSKSYQKVKKLKSRIENRMPIAGVLTDAAASAAEIAAEEVRSAAIDVLQRSGRRGGGKGSPPGATSSNALRLETQARIEADAQVAMDAISLAKTSVADAFDAAESALAKAEAEIARARSELEGAKRDAALGLAVAEKAAAEAAVKARRATERTLEKEVERMDSLEEEGDGSTGGVAGAGKEEGVENEAMESGGPWPGWTETELKAMDAKAKAKAPKDAAAVTAVAASESVEETSEPEGDDDVDDGSGILSGKWTDFDLADLSYEDVDYTLTDMAPPFINEDECLVPGEPVVRVEKAPQNSRRIFAGIDIPVSVDAVWDLLTDYPNLQKVVPNLVVNEVLELYPGTGKTVKLSGLDDAMTDAEQCRTLAEQMKGAVLRQVGGAKVVGINFSARTTLEVREWPGGMPDFAHFEDEVYDGKSRSDRVRESKRRELARYVFPRPFALSSLPHKDISMQSVEDDDGEFRMYQGVWRMQPLPGCSPPGGSAMRLTYAVEVSPRPYLPVALVEGRIAQDLCSNLKAIRDVFAG